MLRRRRIEEEFRTIAPPGRRGILLSAPIAVGVAGSGGADTVASMSQAWTEIQQLQAQFRQISVLIAAHPQEKSSAGGPGSDGGFGGGLFGFLSPIASGLISLFGASHSSAPAPLPYYVAPPAVQIGESLRSTPAQPSPTSSATPNIIVNVSAMDSQSFLDRSNDIASAVREAMLNLHPINDVVASL